MARECLEFAYYFKRPNTKLEADYINANSHLQFIGHVLWRNAAVELAKLLSTSERTHKFNIYTFLLKFEKTKIYGHYEIETEVLINWHAKIESYSHITTKIIMLRDKVYSHTDGVKFDQDFSPTFEEVKEVIKLIEDIIQDISNRTIKVHYDMSNVIFLRDRFKMIENLAEFSDIRRKRILEKYGLKSK